MNAAQRRLAGAGALCLVLLAGYSPPGHSDPASAGLAAYRRGDYQHALAELRPLAEEGYGPACVVVGRIYLDGKGVTRDATTAARFFERGAASADAVATSYLGDLYQQGTGVPRDPEKALGYWRKAGQLGEPLAAHNLGIALSRGTHGVAERKLALLWLDAAIAALNESSEHLRAEFVRDRDALAAELGPAAVAAAAAIVSPEAPAIRAALLNQDAIFKRSVALYPDALRRSGGRANVVCLLFVRADGTVGEVRRESSSGHRELDAATVELLRGALIEPKRVRGAPVAAWQLVKWTWPLRP